MPKKPAKKAPKKSKGPKIRKISENEIHMHCALWLRLTHPGLLAFHVVNESEAPVQYRVKLKRKGLLAGVADFLAFPENGRKAAIELKDDKNVQSADQIRFQKRWERSGGEYYLVRTVKEFRNVVTALMLFG